MISILRDSIMAQNNGRSGNNLMPLDINSLNSGENEFIALLQRSLVGKERLIRCLLAIKDLMANIGHGKKSPIGILLCGPSGTGKTLASELIAECFLGDRDGLFRILGFQEITKGMLMKAWEPYLPERAREIATIIGREFEKYAENSRKAPGQKDENGRRRRPPDSQKTLRASQKRAAELQDEYKDELGDFGVKLEISSQGEIGVAIKRDCLRVIVVEGVDMLPREAQKMFASILETGRIRIDDNQEIDFKNSIFIFTAKKDCEKLLKGKNGHMGFSQGSKKDKDEQIYGKLMPILKKNVDELLLCRLFKIIAWGYLTEEQMHKIFDILVRAAATLTSEEPSVCIEIHQEVKDYFIERSLKDEYREYGAWRLAALVNDEILSKIARLKSAKQVNNGDIIVIKLVVKKSVKKIEFFKRPADADDKKVVVPYQIIK